MFKKLILGSLVALSLTCFGVSVAEAHSVVEKVPVHHHHHRTVWVGAHWYRAWNGEWVWTTGHYVKYTHGWKYVYAHYELRGNTWIWLKGYWVRH